MLKCLAVDDEPLALRQLVSYIGKSPIWSSSQGATTPSKRNGSSRRKPST